MLDPDLFGPDALPLARSLLPGWVVWGSTVTWPALAFLAACAIVVVVGVREAPAFRRLESAHWTERARVWYSVQNTAVSAGAVSILGFALIAATCRNDLAPPSTGTRVLLVVIAGDAATILCRRWLALYFRIGVVPVRRWLRRVATVYLRGPVVLLMLVCVLYLPARLDTQSAPWFALAVGSLLFFGVGGGLYLLEALGLARRLAAEDVGDSGRPASNDNPPTFLAFDLTIANAFANPVLNQISITEPALDVLDRAELASVMHHERAHLREPRKKLAARLLPLVLVVVLALCRSLVLGLGPEGYAALVLVLAVLCIAARRWNRTSEEVADASARELSADAATYARALERLHKANLTPAVLRRRASHPHLYDRLLACGVQPDYARPEPPVQRGFVFGLPLLLLSLTIGLLVGALGRADRPADQDVPDAMFDLAFRGETSNELQILARLERASGDSDRAVAFYRAASVLDRATPYAPAHLSIALTDSHRCDEAASALVEARRRTPASTKHRKIDDLIVAADEVVARCRDARPADGARVDGTAGQSGSKR